ncbi:MAG: twitch domain-containing radical SAM protein [Planctomycetota bacterium]|jgi:MoaA/NifB/PqqE/SkfB family radical SAM enzyme
MKYKQKVITNKSKSHTERNENHHFSKTFCILPWIHAFIDNNGEVKLCCIARNTQADESGKPLQNFQLQSLREIWNSAEMRDVRRKMLAGEKVDACYQCDNAAFKGQTTNREIHNHRWLITDPERNTWKKRVQDSINNDFHTPELPVHYDIRPGNLCNLKCRMCHADYSRLIRNDPVHSKWAYRSPDIIETRFSDGSKWYESESVIIDELLENIEETRGFYLAGGEPLINPFIKKLIDILIERKVAHNISLEFSSNLTVFDEVFFKKLNSFKWVHMSLSIDGAGPVYDYIRYPGKWTDVERHLKRLSLFPKFLFCITATIQNYNVLSITDLFKYAESLNIPCKLNLLHSPIYLNIGVMPQKARLLAAKRLKEYVDISLMVRNNPDVAATIDNVLLELEQVSEKLYRQYIREFMTFTNDLDKSRNQSFKASLPELYHYINEDSSIWTEEVRHYCSQNE